MDGKIIEIDGRVLKLKHVWSDDDCGGFHEWVEVYEKTGCDDEFDPYEWIGDIDRFDFDDEDLTEDDFRKQLKDVL